MPGLAELIAAAGFPDDTPVAVAIIAAGARDVAVSGRWSADRAVTADDRFYAASLAKQLTGAVTGEINRVVALAAAALDLAAAR